MTEIKAVLFDMDGVMASVGNSYRRSIQLTAAHFGADVTQEDISIEKKLGNSNNDWILSQRLIQKKAGLDVSIEEVTRVFEDIYQGTPGKPGLCETETLITAKGLIEEVYRRCEGRIAVVTGRPRKDCATFLNTHSLTDLFKVCICMEDAPAKPCPDGCKMACKALNIDSKYAIMVGDTPDDIKAAVGAGARGFGVLTPEEEARLTLGLSAVQDGMTNSLLGSGAEKILKAGLGELLDLIPSLASSLPTIASDKRIGTVSRKTKETEISVSINLDGTGKADIDTGIGFLDHMLSQLAKHGRFDITLHCSGDLHIDDHHTSEDCALALGEAFDKALGKRESINRFGHACCPLDEALSRVVVDISSRPHAVIDLQFTREMIGTISCEMLQHCLESFALTARITLHVHNMHGTNNHHKAESAFKALAVALRQAVAIDLTAGVPSTKGLLS